MPIASFGLVHFLHLSICHADCRVLHCFFWVVISIDIAFFLRQHWKIDVENSMLIFNVDWRSFRPPFHIFNISTFQHSQIGHCFLQIRCTPKVSIFVERVVICDFLTHCALLLQGNLEWIISWHPHIRMGHFRAYLFFSRNSECEHCVTQSIISKLREKNVLFSAIFPNFALLRPRT